MQENTGTFTEIFRENTASASVSRGRAHWVQQRNSEL